MSIKFDKREKTCIYPYYISPYKYAKRINLLVIGDDKCWHYIYIKSLETLLAGKTKHRRKAFVCPRCHKQTTIEKVFIEHMLICESDTKQLEVMPEDTIMKFKNFQNRQRNAVTVYAG